MSTPRVFPETVPAPDDEAYRAERARLNAVSPLGPNTHSANILHDGTRSGFVRSAQRLIDAAPADVTAVSFLWGDELVVVPRRSFTSNRQPKPN